MVLTPGQQKALFVLVVIVLGAFGYFLVVPGLRHSHGPGQAAASPTPAEQYNIIHRTQLSITDIQMCLGAVQIILVEIL